MTQDKYSNLAYQYAPIFAQKVSNEWKVADQIAPIDFAGSIKDVAKNPDALYELEDDAIIPAKVYYSVCETSTHYFLIYAVYHVLDWWKRYEPKDLYNRIRDRLDSHIHDMEGVLFVVTKEPKNLIDAVVTVFHYDFYLYSEPQIPTNVGEARRAYPQNLRIVNFNRQDVDGNIWLDQSTERVKLYIQSRGHGIRGDHDGWGGGDEIWYYNPSDENASPGTIDTEEKDIEVVEYELEDIFADEGLWHYRFNDRVFRQNKNGRWGFVYKAQNGELRGGAANPPWSWNDRNDPSPMGEIATDPARFIIRYAQGWGPVSTEYIYNPYQSIGSTSG